MPTLDPRLRDDVDRDDLPTEVMARARRAARRLPGLGLITVGVGLLVVLLLAFDLVFRLVPSLHNPFSNRTVDRSQPVLLESIQNLSRYEAAVGNFQVVVDLEKDARYIPSIVKGERTLFVAAGSVNAYVEFGGLQSDAIAVSNDRRSVTITLPTPVLDKASIDSNRSYVFEQKRGLVDRLASVFTDDANNQQQLYQLAALKIEAAAVDAGLVARAEENTRSALTGMMHSLGFTSVVVHFQPPASPSVPPPS